MTSLSLAVGAPDIETPPAASTSAVEAMFRGETRYVGAAGLLPLREAVQANFEKQKGLHYSVNDIVVGGGAKLTLFCVLSAILTPGASVILPAPYYGGYRGLVARAGGRMITVETSSADGYKMTPGQLAEALDDSTQVVMINSPSNPTGAVYSREELRELADVVLAHSSAVIVSDEIYSRFVYDGVEHVSVASLGPEVQARTVVVDGVSKAFGMTGWRVGYACGPSEIITRAKRVNTELENCASSISQWAAVGALTGAAADHLNLASHQRRRDLALAAVQSWNGVEAFAPQGGIYQAVQFAVEPWRFPPAVTNLDEFSRWVSEQADVAFGQGTTFGRQGLARLTFSVPEAVLADSLARIGSVLRDLD